MSRIPVQKLQVNQNVDQVFAVADCQFAVTKVGKPYARLRLGDSSGTVAGIFWDIPDPMAKALRESGFVRVKGSVQTYRDELQVNVDSIDPVELGADEARDFMPATDKDVDVLWQRLVEIMGAIENEHLSQFVGTIIADERLVQAIKNAPAAVQMHHAYLGGLLEHTLSMAECALKLCEHYTELNRDLLLAGVLIHDIGKVREFSCETGIGYSDAGRLVGHIAIGVSIVEEKARSVEGFPPVLEDLLKHYVLSHHGEAQYGAIRSPMTAEAIALHYMDNLDAKLAAFRKAAREPGSGNGNWTAYQRMFESYLYRGDVLGADGPAEGGGKDTGRSGGGIGLF
jgi:3'-5' exoribonuclease